MACKYCTYIANNIWCQGCSDDIEESCDNGECDAASMLKIGSVNGHRWPPFKEVNGLLIPDEKGEL